MIRFPQTTTLYVVRQYDEERDLVVDDGIETFEADVQYDAEIIEGSEDDDDVDLQFADGSVAFSVRRSSFEVIGENNPLAYKPQIDTLPLP